MVSTGRAEPPAAAAAAAAPRSALACDQNCTAAALGLARAAAAAATPEMNPSTRQGMPRRPGRGRAAGRPRSTAATCLGPCLRYQRKRALASFSANRPRPRDALLRGSRQSTSHPTRGPHLLPGRRQPSPPPTQVWEGCVPRRLARCKARQLGAASASKEQRLLSTPLPGALPANGCAAGRRTTPTAAASPPSPPGPPPPPEQQAGRAPPTQPRWPPAPPPPWRTSTAAPRRPNLVEGGGAGGGGVERQDGPPPAGARAMLLTSYSQPHCVVVAQPSIRESLRSTLCKHSAHLCRGHTHLQAAATSP